MTMCSLCRRNLLAGERYRRWEPEPGRGARPVCSLCEPEAARVGWLRPTGALEHEGAGGLRWTARKVA